MKGGTINEVKERGGYGWNDASCSHKHESSDEGKKIRNLQEAPCLCEWPASLAPDYADLASDEWFQFYPSELYMFRAVLAGLFGYMYVLAVLYFVRKSATALIRKQLKVSEHAVLEHTAKREGRENVSLSDVTHEDQNKEFLRLVRQAQTPNPLTAGEAELQ